MKKMTYKQAEEFVLNWYDSNNTDPFVVVFVDSNCPNCKHFEENLQSVIENHGVDVIYVSMSQHKIAFPPLYTPTTYWYFNKDTPPMVKKGAPPDLDVLSKFLNQILKVNRGESTVDEEFF